MPVFLRAFPLKDDSASVCEPEGEGIYVLLFGGELEARRVSEGVHGEKDSRLVMTFDGARADPVSITRARFAKYVYAKAVAVQINLWPAGLQHHG